MRHLLMADLSNETIRLLQFHFTGLCKNLSSLMDNILDALDGFKIDSILEINKTLFLVKI